jgi:hypothetical protein
VNPNLNPSKRADVVGSIDPDAYAAGTIHDRLDRHEQVLLAARGRHGRNARRERDARRQDPASDRLVGTGAKDVTGLAITQLTQAGADSNKQALINVMQGDLDRNNGFTHVRLSMTIATAASDAGAVVLGFDPRYGDAEANDKASVDEIVS